MAYQVIMRIKKFCLLSVKGFDAKSTSSKNSVASSAGRGATQRGAARVVAEKGKWPCASKLGKQCWMDDGTLT